MGHSLGGAQAQIFATEYPASTGYVMTFNSLNVSRNTVQTLRNMKKQNDL